MHLENIALKMASYTRITTCRRKYILEYFDDDNAYSLQTRKDCCDNCFILSNKVDYREIYEGLDNDGKLNITEDALMFLTVLRDLKGRFGLGKIIWILRGSKRQELPQQYYTHHLFGKGSKKSEAWYKLLSENLQALGYTQNITKQSAFGGYTLLDLTTIAENWLKAAPNKREAITIEPYADVLKFLKPKMAKISSSIQQPQAAESAFNLKAENSELMRALIT